MANLLLIDLLYWSFGLPQRFGRTLKQITHMRISIIILKSQDRAIDQNELHFTHNLNKVYLAEQWDLLIYAITKLLDLSGNLPHAKAKHVQKNFGLFPRFLVALTTFLYKQSP